METRACVRVGVRCAAGAAPGWVGSIVPWIRASVSAGGPSGRPGEKGYRWIANGGELALTRTFPN